MRNLSKITFLLILAFLILGCSGKSAHLKQRDVSNIKKIAVVRNVQFCIQFIPSKPKMVTQSKPKKITPSKIPYSILESFATLFEDLGTLVSLPGYIFNYYPRAIESIKQEMEPIAPLLAPIIIELDAEVENLFDKELSKKLAMTFEIIGPEVTDTMDLQNHPKTKGSNIFKITFADNSDIQKYPETKANCETKLKDYTIFNEKLGADAVLEINLDYGLFETLEKSKYNAAAIAYVTLTDVVQNKLLVEEEIRSDSFNNKGYPLALFVCDDGELLRQGVFKAIQDIVEKLHSVFLKAA